MQYGKLLLHDSSPRREAAFLRNIGLQTFFDCLHFVFSMSLQYFRNTTIFQQLFIYL